MRIELPEGAVAELYEGVTPHDLEPGVTAHPGNYIITHLDGLHEVLTAEAFAEKYPEVSHD
jgi:hypothetical protein